jgi:hypothetical protein
LLFKPAGFCDDSLALILLFLITALIIFNLLIELTMVGLSVRFFAWEIRRRSSARGLHHDLWAMGVILILLLVGHLLQMAVWAVGFIRCGEFSDMRTAFYHSSVNYAALGYGDIVMSEKWRLLGGIEAAVGVMMFGVSAALLFSVLGKLTQIHLRESMDSDGDE